MNNLIDKFNRDLFNAHDSSCPFIDYEIRDHNVIWMCELKEELKSGSFYCSCSNHLKCRFYLSNIQDQSDD